MSVVTTLKSITSYLNSGENKKGMATFKAELDALDPLDKLWMGAAAAEAMGDTHTLSIKESELLSGADPAVLLAHGLNADGTLATVKVVKGKTSYVSA